MHIKRITRVTLYCFCLPQQAIDVVATCTFKMLKGSGMLVLVKQLLNNMLDLLGLTNLGTKCELEDVVCKYEQVRALRFETAIFILHFASCIFRNLLVAKI